MKMNLRHIAFIGRRCETRCFKKKRFVRLWAVPQGFWNRSLGEGSWRPRQVIGTASAIPLKPRKIAVIVRSVEDPVTVCNYRKRWSSASQSPLAPDLWRTPHISVLPQQAPISRIEARAENQKKGVAYSGWMPHGDTSLIETGLLELAAFETLLGMCRKFTRLHRPGCTGEVELWMNRW